jgi:hypothetical protein
MNAVTNGKKNYEENRFTLREEHLIRTEKEA